ncbi:MAG: deoxyguanosinetriphosphate triphosphohydrolase [Gammaproteobacteria bacterium]|jgi:dGTPase|nr:deoxyguanosinetriphosphate triphosphohydrolase [Gammaproteobacteria bacterium]MBT3488102.1 deoxyguanosinetriphosphate triphosphohydrolase [Gammaproteobacteria bacterium]MBT3719558.1 deoxyguanosinetriphosphate triphosphohydrolase [Gammaproteobacteria bacterium]MBT3844906.1 deoxyguanosinetriphosphate triphosphohydrolase [Gammaproteobacteria bacterium]MBT3893893.1 deoxyguanosinetriphosphate triphosphohydrolase [Gammaproteobacteria bacterium]
MADPCNLAPYAAHDSSTRGRIHPESSPRYRSAFQRDRDRIVHSTAFRRLEYKTQVFVNHEGDLYRTRLTHSVEVAQIGRSIARTLRLNEDLTEAIALAHDLGHTPFGHAGQDALNRCMTPYGGFEHNFQSLRVVDHLEEKYAQFAGLNLTFESREGILKHCSKSNARQVGMVGERFLNMTQPSLEAQLVNLADQIAYNNHDVDDGLRAGLITIEQLCEIYLFREQYETVVSSYPKLNQRRTIHEVVRRMINRLVIDIVETSEKNLAEAMPENIETVRQHNGPLICFSEEQARLNHELKHFLREKLYRHYRVMRMTLKAERILSELFEAFLGEPRLLPDEQYELTLKLPTTDQARVITDYIAGMTDRYALSEHQKLFSPPVPTV